MNFKWNFPRKRVYWISSKIFSTEFSYTKIKFLTQLCGIIVYNNHAFKHFRHENTFYFQHFYHWLLNYVFMYCTRSVSLQQFLESLIKVIIYQSQHSLVAIVNWRLWNTDAALKISHNLLENLMKKSFSKWSYRPKKNVCIWFSVNLQLKK